MKRKIEEWTVEKIYEEREQITFPDYQRAPKLWNTIDKQLLIDSILQDIDIPKLYFNILTKDEYEVVDGQQRLWAIWQFINNEYPYESQSKNKQLMELNNKKFRDFPKNFRDKILSYKFQIVLFTDATDEYLRKLFLRLQLGLLLITGEKLKATAGLMKGFIFKKMVNHPFIKKINIPNRRFAKQTLCAQICINSFSIEDNNEFSRTRYEDLNYFFEEYKKLKGNELKFFNNKCNNIISVLDVLNAFYGKKAESLRNRSFILSIYLFVEEMIKTHRKRSLDNVMPMFVEFTFKFLNRLKAEAEAGFYRKNEELYRFQSYLSNAPGEKYQIISRHRKIEEFF